MNYHFLSIWRTFYLLLFKHFFYSKLFSTSFLQLFFIKTSSKWFTIQIINNICLRDCIFNFANKKNFFWPIWSVSFINNILVFLNPNMIANFKFRIFFIRIFIVFSIRIRWKVKWFLFNSSMNCVIVFINNII